jgi:hypothetical protein
MTLHISPKRFGVALAFVLGFSGIILWLKAEHNPRVPVAVAKAFVDQVEAKQFVQAYELTTKRGYVGTTVAEFEEISRHELCKDTRIIGTWPFQSNGNRLRRWASGKPVEMSEVQVEFEGPCLIRVTVRHMQGNEWRVSRFVSHAG